MDKLSKYPHLMRYLQQLKSIPGGSFHFGVTPHDYETRHVDWLFASVANLFDDLRAGIFSELVSTKPVIDLYRRNLQRSFVTTFGGKLSGSGDGIPAIPASRVWRSRQAFWNGSPR